MEEPLELIRKSQNGDAIAFKEIVIYYNKDIYGQILRILKNEQDAQDITQVTWIKVWKKIDTFKFESAFSTWLYRVATFSALDALRKRKLNKETSLDSLTVESQVLHEHSTPPNQIKHLETQELKEFFHCSLEKLSPPNKEAIKLREIDGLSYSEIAQRLNCKPGTIMSRIFNARKALQHLMKDFLT